MITNRTWEKISLTIIFQHNSTAAAAAVDDYNDVAYSSITQVSQSAAGATQSHSICLCLRVCVSVLSS